MSAAVSTMQQHQPGGGSNPASRMGTNSPVDNKRITIKNEDSRSSIPHPQAPTNSVQAPSAPPDPTPEKNSDRQDSHQKNSNTQSQNEVQTNNAPDYFSIPRPNRLDQEPNPFEQSFASGGTSTNANDTLATPKAILPPVTAMTSPAPLLGGSSGYNWGPNSLRSGPLSPAMLQGPTNSGSLGFDTHLRTGLTPNESGIRSGLTPGGSGSMFPAPSPSGSFMFGSATPGTMEFQKTALSAARKSGSRVPPQPELKSEDNLHHSNSGLNDQQKPRQPSDSFNADPAHNAANGLYLLAQMGGAPNTYQQAHMSGIPPNSTNNMDSSPSLAKRAAMNSATSAANRAVSSSIVPNGVRGVSEISNNRSDSSEEPENPNGRKGSRSSRGKGSSTGKRKNDAGSDSGKGVAKKPKSGRSIMGSDGEDDDDDDGQNDLRKDGKKMTDEEKRKNFLERNRVAALKCRQRKKQWLANLQAKVEMYGTENDALNATVQSLREEIVSLKTLLLAHKDCPVARANGVQLDIASLAAAGGDYGPVPMMGYPNMMAGVMHQQSQGERRYS